MNSLLRLSLFFVVAALVFANPVSAGSLRIRKEINNLTPIELNTLRKAYKGLQAKAGPGGYQDLAGFHGKPKFWCPHHDPHFLPWHRAYILKWEDSLRKIEPSVTLPFWDWTSAGAIASGIPPAFSDQNCTIDGKMEKNPLFSARVEVDMTTTSRNPRPASLLQFYATDVQNCFAQTTFLGFNSALSGPHDSLHTWVRGDMGQVSTAAYDPIFWSHHANVDRQWAQWQRGANNAMPIGSLLTDPLKGMGTLKVKDVIDYRNDLKYDYEGISPMPPIIIAKIKINAQLLAMIKRFKIGPDDRRILLVVEDVKSGAESFNVNVFVNDPKATVQTKLAGNPNFAGTFGIFGAGKGAPVHEEHAVPHTVDVSKAVQRHAENGEVQNLTLKLVVEDLMGRPVEFERVPFRTISLRLE